MNVLLVSPWQTGAGASGVASACRNLAEGLVATPGVGGVVVLSLGAERASETLCEGRVRVERLPRQARLALLTNGLPDFLRASRWLREERFRPDVVHGQGFAGEGHVGVRLARRLKVPAVVTVHGMVDKEARLYGDPMRAALARAVMSQTLRGARGVVFVSPYRREELAVGRRVDARVIENAISSEVFDVRSDGVSSSILYAGFIGPRKRLLDLVRALAVVRRDVPAARLRVAGPPSDREYVQMVEAEVRTLGLGDAVDFLGPLDPAALRSEYARAAALALPSEEENAPQVIAEAMAAGVPPVATDVGGIRWMIRDGRDGFVVPVEDVAMLAGRLTELLSSPERRKDMAAAARAEAERFRPESVAGQTLDLYRTLVSRAG